MVHFPGNTSLGHTFSTTPVLRDTLAAQPRMTNADCKTLGDTGAAFQRWKELNMKNLETSVELAL